MTTINTILIDDEPRALASLQKLLEINCPAVNVAGCYNNAEDGREAIQRLRPQLVFLDIAMPGTTGLDLLRSLADINFEIIFVSAHNNFITQAFRFSAVDYILKPVDEELLTEAVKRAEKKIEEKNGGKYIETFLHNLGHKESLQKMKLCIPSLKGFQVVNMQDIIYCEASGNYTNFNFTNQPVICASKPIHEYEALLADADFIRIHKSFIVNLAHIKEYIRGEGGAVILSNNQTIEVSRRKKDLLMTKMKQHFKY